MDTRTGGLSGLRLFGIIILFFAVGIGTGFLLMPSPPKNAPTGRTAEIIKGVFRSVKDPNWECAPMKVLILGETLHADCSVTTRHTDGSLWYTVDLDGWVFIIDPRDTSRPHPSPP